MKVVLWEAARELSEAFDIALPNILSRLVRPEGHDITRSVLRTVFTLDRNFCDPGFLLSR